MYLEHIWNGLVNYQISYKNYDKNVQNLENKSYQIQNVLIIFGYKFEDKITYFLNF
jgi:hypothetical protein